MATEEHNVAKAEEFKVLANEAFKDKMQFTLLIVPLSIFGLRNMGYYRRGAAHLGLGKFKEALKDFQQNSVGGHSEFTAQHFNPKMKMPDGCKRAISRHICDCRRRDRICSCLRMPCLCYIWFLRRYLGEGHVARN